jgi:hypothetical protein
VDKLIRTLLAESAVVAIVIRTLRHLGTRLSKKRTWGLESRQRRLHPLKVEPEILSDLGWRAKVEEETARKHRLGMDVFEGPDYLESSFRWTFECGRGRRRRFRQEPDVVA